MSEAPIPVEVFCSYAHEDEAWRDKLERHLSPLKQRGLISLWHDRLITPGTNWAKVINTHLESASVILLLVSADFFASDYCYGIEMKRALARQEAGEARVIPLLIRPVAWNDAPFAHLQALPTDAQPLSTWQNEDTALAAITTGIRNVIVEDLPQLSASAPRTALPAIWNIPYPRNPFFLGRDMELVQIRQQLLAGQATALSQPQAISGLGGIGKTQLALEYAYRYHRDYQMVLWVHAESTEALISSYVALAILLRLPEREAKEHEVTIQAVKTWLQTHRGWLLILDNADELALLPHFLSPTLEGHLLLTTRASATGRLAHRLEIETLQPEQGAIFLLRRSGLIAADAPLEQASSQEQKLAMQISQELGGLPLAMDQAGAYLEETGTDLINYWQIYQLHRADLLRERRGLVADHPEPVATTWSLSFQKIEEKNLVAANLLRLCAFLAPDAIPEEALIASTWLQEAPLTPLLVDAFRLNQAIEMLRAYSLMRRDPKGKTLSIHRLVQAVIQDALQEVEKRTWAKLAVLSINAAFPSVEFHTWPQCERLLPQALIAIHIIERYQIISEEAGHLLHLTASYLDSRARYREAEPLFLRALSLREQYLGPQHPQLATSLTSLAILYNAQDKYIEAEPLLLRALQIWGQYPEAEHPQASSPLQNLGNLYRWQGKYAEAEQHYQQALRLREDYLGPEHPSVANALNGLAKLYNELGKHAEAEQFYLRALRIKEHQLSPGHPGTAHILNNLADLYREQGKYTEAEQFYLRALRAREQHLGIEHPWIAYSLNGLGKLYREQGRYTKAKTFFQRALRIREQYLGSEHHETAETIDALAQLREAQGNRKEARSLYTHALTIREQALGAEHPKTAETRSRLIALLHELGQHEQAAQLEAVQSEL